MGPSVKTIQESHRISVASRYEIDVSISNTGAPRPRVCISFAPFLVVTQQQQDTARDLLRDTVSRALGFEAPSPGEVQAAKQERRLRALLEAPLRIRDGADFRADAEYQIQAILRSCLETLDRQGILLWPERDGTDGAVRVEI